MKISGKQIVAIALAGLANVALLVLPAFSQPEPGGPHQPGMEQRQRGREMAPPAPGGPERMGGPQGMRGMGGPRGGQFSVAMLLSPKGREELGVTDEQAEKLKALQLESEKKSIDQEAELKKAELDLREAMDTEGDLDRGTILAKIDAVGKLRTERQKLEVSQMLDARAVLTADQIKKVRELREKRRAEVRERRGPGGPEDGQGSGERPDRPPRGERMHNPDGPDGPPPAGEAPAPQ